VNGPPSLSVTDIQSRSSDPSTFWALTTMPGRTGSTQTRTFGVPSTVIWQFGQWPEQQSRPRGRWYLKLRLKMRRPAANSAEPTVSPGKAVTGFPSKVSSIVSDRSIRSVG